jgi:3-hydroxyacyl-CoA dehydrogenase
VNTRTCLENAFWLACDDLLFTHTNPWELDEALKNFGFGIGPCEVMDHVGLINVHARDGAHASAILPRMVTEGRVGKIGGVGFYRYPGGGGAVIDPLIEDLILEEAWFAKVARTPLNDTQLVDYILEKLKAAIQGVNHETALAIVCEQLHFPRAKLDLITA